MAWFRRSTGFLEHIFQTPQGFLLILLLCTILSGYNNQYTLVIDAPACKFNQPQANIVRQRRGMENIETQLNRAGKLIDILPAGSRSMDSAEFQLAIIDGKRISN